MGDSVDPETKERIMNTVNQSLASNRDKVQVLDSTIRSLYTVASGLVNNGAETLRGFGLVQTALDVRQQSIMRKAGPFVKPTSSVAEPKPGPKDKPICARSSATNAPKKRKSRGKGRQNKGLPPHPIPPPLSPKPKKPKTSMPVPAGHQDVSWGGRDVCPQ